jgi:hypothetical protein
MAYSVPRSNPANGVVTVQDNLIEGSSTPALSIDLVGRNAIDYGDNIAETQVRLLENFASPTAPANPIPGQLWYDSGTSQLNVNTGTTDGEQTWTAVGAGGGTSVFLGLTDTPTSYAGQGGQFVRVNVAETGLEFVTGSGSGGLNAVSDDPSPVLGGNLDTSTFRLLTTDTSENVVIQRAAKIEGTVGTSPGFFLTDIDVNATTNRPTVIIAGGGPLGGGEATLRMQFSDRLDVGDTATKANQTFFGADENGEVFIEAPGALNPGTQSLRFQNDGNLRRDTDAADPVNERDLITRGFQGPRVLTAFSFSMAGAGSFFGNPYGVDTVGPNAPVRSDDPALATSTTIPAGVWDFYLPELDALTIPGATLADRAFSVVGSVQAYTLGTVGIGAAVGAQGFNSGASGRTIDDGWVTISAYNSVVENDDIIANPGAQTVLFGQYTSPLVTSPPDNQVVQVIIYDTFTY